MSALPPIADIGRRPDKGTPSETLKVVTFYLVSGLSRTAVRDGDTVAS
jgi:hypothetical protein